MAKLRRVLTHPGKNESGQGALAMVLLLLMLGAIILTPLLVFMQTGVKAGQVYESKLQEFYAADSGVEAEIYKISQNHTNLSVPDYRLNDRNVTVDVPEIKNGIYKIVSTAASDSGGNTTIECYYGALDYSSFLDNAISSNDTVKIVGKVDVTGNVSAPDCTDAGYPGCSCTNCTYSIDCVNCTNCCSQEPLSWPTAEELSKYYYDKVKNLTPYGDMDINIATLTPPEIGPLYVDGELKIYNDEQGKSAKLNGTVYVTGDTIIEGSGNKNWTLNLNNQTIFVESDSSKGHEALKIGGHQVALAGSGCIIVVGDIDFHPGIVSGSENDFIFVMSVENTVTLLPSGKFYGSVAGELDVEVHSGDDPFIIWTDYKLLDILLDFPMGQTENRVLSYTIR